MNDEKRKDLHRYLDYLCDVDAEILVAGMKKGTTWISHVFIGNANCLDSMLIKLAKNRSRLSEVRVINKIK